ncbi:MAG TPA: molybdopterin cofactor-binding domain-containing protein [Acidimicrobiia bacterium]|nr:molybdopterin cofactor-binding domain-containing protein [Acidimicrobiia bacterium]
MSTTEAPPQRPTTIVGQRVLRSEGRGLVSGRAKYIADMYLPGMLHVKAKLGPYANARILRIDTSRAEALPGVVAVVTHEDVPVNRHGLFVQDQPVLADEYVRHLGEPVAAVAAVDELTAAEAVELIQVEYEPLPPVVDALEGMKPGAPVIHEGGNVVLLPGYDVSRRVRLGDVDAAFAEADLIVESTYSTGVREHAAMETHASVAEVDGAGKVTIYTCSQAPHLHQMFIAGILEMPLHKVRMAGGRVGGGFGKGNDLCIDHITALLARKSQRPVKWVLTREEENLSTSKDQAYPRIHMQSAVKRDGTIIGRKVEAIQDTGAYNLFGSGGIDKISVYLRGPYNIPNYSFDGWVVYTNKPPSAAMRGFNVADAHVAYDGHTEEIAAALGMDPLELRLKNLVRTGDTTSTHGVFRDATVRECVIAAAERFGWTSGKPAVVEPDNPSKRRGVGICAGFQGTGLTCGSDPGTAEIEIMGDGSVLCRVGVAEIGAGEGTVLAMITAEELGVPLESVTVTLGDTEVTPFDTGTFGNRVTYINGHAVRRAAQELRRLVFDLVAEQLGVEADGLVLAEGVVFSEKNPEQQMTLAAVAGTAQWTGKPPLIGRGAYLVDGKAFDNETGAATPTEQYIFACCMLEVEVDTRTGVVDVVRSVLVHDVGKAINPLFCEGQMDGGMAFGIGMALLEDLYPQYPAIIPVPRGLHEYKLATTMDMPDDHTNVILEIPSATGPFGAKALGEYTANLQAPAILNAIHDATGVWVRQVPVSPEQLLRLLKAEAEA